MFVFRSAGCGDTTYALSVNSPFYCRPVVRRAIRRCGRCNVRLCPPSGLLGFGDVTTIVGDGFFTALFGLLSGGVLVVWRLVRWGRLHLVIWDGSAEDITAADSPVRGRLSPRTIGRGFGVWISTAMHVLC